MFLTFLYKIFFILIAKSSLQPVIESHCGNMYAAKIAKCRNCIPYSIDRRKNAYHYRVIMSSDDRLK